MPSPVYTWGEFHMDFINRERKISDPGPKRFRRRFTPTNTVLYNSRIYDDFRYGLWWPELDRRYQEIKEDSIGQAYNFFDRNNSYVSSIANRPMRRAPYLLRTPPRRSFYARYLDNYIFDQK